MTVAALPVLDGARVRLRPPSADDAAALFAAFGDPLAMRWWDRPPFASPAALGASLAAMASRDATAFGAWAVVLKDGGGPVGAVFYHHRELQHRRVEIGYILAPAHWGKGLMGEALDLLLDHCVTALAVYRIEATVSPENSASARLLERLGFRCESGVIRHRIQYAPDDFRDAVLYGLLATDRTLPPGRSYPENRSLATPKL